MPTNNSVPSPSDQRTECEQDPVGSIGTQLSFLLEKPLKELVETIVAKNPGKVNQDDEGEALFDQIQRSLNRIWKKMRGTILRVVRDSNILRRAGVTDKAEREGNRISARGGPRSSPAWQRNHPHAVGS